jgi:hypothetical protein
MIKGLDQVLADSQQPGLDELRALLKELLDGPGCTGHWLDQTKLKPCSERVYRLRFAINDQLRSVVVKRLRPETARRNELVAQRWLPAIGLSGRSASVVGSAAARTGGWAWHVYEDLGQCELNSCQPDRERVRAAVELLAQVHTRFAGQPLMGEVRLHGGDLGLHFHEATVHDALRALIAWKPPGDCWALRARLLRYLHRLNDQLPQRAQAMTTFGGPETLLHGDLWANNVFVIPTATGLHARLIDWDHAAVGPYSYDLSTFLLRFPAEHRRWVLEMYRQAVAPAGWRLPSLQALNSLFETHEYVRIVNRLIWPAIAQVADHAPWGVEALNEVGQWFEAVTPVLPRPEAHPSAQLVPA